MRAAPEAHKKVKSYEKFLLDAIAKGDEKEQRWWAARLLVAQGEENRILCSRSPYPDRMYGRTVYRARAEFTQKAPELWSWLRVSE